MATPRPRREPPRIEALRALILFAETGSVTATAERLRVSQPVVTTKLEAFRDGKAVGKVLIDDDNRLTATAERALPAMRQVVRLYDQLLDDLTDETQTPQRLRVAVGAFSAQWLFPRALARFRELSPADGIEAQVAHGEDRILGVADGRYDVAIVSHAPGQIDDVLDQHRPHAPKLAIENLASHLLVVIAARASKVGQELLGTPIHHALSIRWLVGKDLLGLDRNSGLRRQMAFHLDTAGKLKFLVEGGGWQAARELARHGLGVAVVPLEVLSDADEEAFVIRRLAETFQPRSRLIYQSSNPLPTLPRWRETLLEVARESQQATEKRWGRLVKEGKAEKRKAEPAG